jgi:uracil-DNA glycosylase
MLAQLASETDLDGFRAEARALLARHVPPDQVHWQIAGAAETDLFDTPASADPAGPASPSGSEARATVPAGFVRLCEEVVLHSHPDRFAHLYLLLWRLVHEPGLRNDPIDPDMLRAQHMAQAVRRDMHKMKAFVRFRKVEDADGADKPLHVAWFEPAHHIVEAVAPWFAKRFTQMRWAILTPARSVAWDGVQISLGPGAAPGDAPPADAGETLWLTYYQSIFNPARLKMKMMQKEMPRKYWHNLPEARLIAPLAAQAQARSETMVLQPASLPARRIPRVLPAASVAAGSALLAGAPSLAQIKEATMRCRDCPIGAHATQSVTGEGPRHARLMFVGEQPGEQEDLRGQPFVGPAGQLFDQALAQLGLPRDEVFVTNAVKHFKFELRGKRRIHKTPTQREASACLHWLEDEIRLAQPGALVALGATAARSLMGRAVAVTAERGQWLERGDGLKVLITLHPSALLRMPPQDKEAAYAAFLSDLSKARALFDAGAAN